MVLYIDNDKTFERLRITSLSDIHTWGGARDRLNDIIGTDFEDALLRYLEDIAPRFTNENFPLWQDTELNDYIWFEDDDWREAIGYYDEDEMKFKILEKIDESYDFVSFAEEYGFEPSVDIIRQRLFESGNEIFDADIDEFKGKSNKEIFEELFKQSSGSMGLLYDELCSLAIDEDFIIKTFRKETKESFTKKCSNGISYYDLEKIYKSSLEI